MKAIVINQFGAADVFKCVEITRPPIQPGHVLIRVAASSVNPLDCKMRQGKLTAITPQFPAILHGDVSGVVEETGQGVSQIKPGDEVYACAGGVKGLQGALAQFMLADARLVAHKPRTLSLQHGAALPLVSITAWNAIIDRANVQAEQRVLIYGATGGVGHIAVQLAKLRGAKVFATAGSDDKAAIAKRLGADEVIRYHDVDMQAFVDEYTQGRGFDVVFDTVGGENIQRAFQAAAINGSVVSVSTRSQQDLSLMHAKGLSLHVVFMLLPMLHDLQRESHGMILQRVADYVDAGKITPLVDAQTFGFSQITSAHRYWESGKAIGKIVLVQDFKT